jgi:hypothetical protein
MVKGSRTGMQFRARGPRMVITGKKMKQEIKRGLTGRALSTENQKKKQKKSKSIHKGENYEEPGKRETTSTQERNGICTSSLKERFG